jgi:preprotein translocase subunit SecA
MASQGIPIIGPILNRILGTRNDRFVKKYTQRVNEINALEPSIRRLTDAQIRAKFVELRDKVDAGASPDDLMVEAFAVAREAMDRGVGIRAIFNPRFGFDPSLLPPPAREVYARVKAEMDATPQVDPTGPFRGCVGAIPGWQQVDIPNELYEAVREVFPESRPPFRARPFDVQLIGGMVLTQGKIAEMRTGEGKTIVAPLACYLACIQRQKVHVVTVNDYLVQRDRDWTFPFFRALGLTVGAIHPQHMQDEEEKRVMYGCDVVYGTTAEFGFDYLRDNMKRDAMQQVQKRRDFAIVDEVDSILIDEARTPLIISGPAHDEEPRYELADKLARHLVEKQRPWTQADERVTKCKMTIKGLEGDIRQARDKGAIPQFQSQLKAAKSELPGLERARDQHTQYFEVKPERKQAFLTHDGVSEAQRVAGLGSIYVDENMDLPHLLEQALRAHVCYERDDDYVVMTVPDPMTGRPTPSIVIVDRNTGRPMVGRQWSDGLHQAIECKERVPIKQETQTVATITIQNFFKMYSRLAGMTGTADTEAQEFHDIYKLDVVAIPTHRMLVRRDFDDMMFLTQKDKWSFIVDEIKAFHDVGRPILVGTTSVDKSEKLSKMLAERYGIQHNVLNAKQHDKEATIIENAGQLGAVMIATNMAGRGTDIKLGAVSREALLHHWLVRGIAPRTLTVDATDEQLREQVYRKVAPQELDIAKREADAMPFDELEVRLLRAWAARHTWASQKDIDSMDAAELREALDRQGRFLLHRLRWFTSMEDMGGLHVVGTERHEARRIDNQLRGRAGRQGDNGSSRFFVAFDDELMKLFAGETQMRVLARLGMKEGDAIEHPMLSKSVERAQRKVEERNFQIRKDVLEYDEIMEHQRQRFYGTRQRVLEGRDVRGLVFDFIRSTVTSAVTEYLDPNYPSICAAEFARDKVDSPIAPERLRGKELHEMEDAIRQDAKYETSQVIDITLGEYISADDAEVKIEYDAAGLIGWARSRFGVELTEDDLKDGDETTRTSIRDRLLAAAEREIDAADLSGLERFVDADFGAKELADWVRETLGFEIKPSEIADAQRAERDARGDARSTVVGPVALIMNRAETNYRTREIEYPVDFTMVLVRQLSQTRGMVEAADYLLNWSNTRFQMNWTADFFKTNTPQAAKEQLMVASRAFVERNAIASEIEAAKACATDEALAEHFTKRFNRPLPETMRYLKGEERNQAIAARVETILRAELLQLERRVLLDTLDDLWRGHLHAMTQLRETIGFRSFSQNDPKIAYKREGSQMFTEMLETAQERVTEYVFKGRLTPELGPAPGAGDPLGGMRPAPRPMGAPAVPLGPGMGSISGPGVGMLGAGGGLGPRPAPGVLPPRGPVPGTSPGGVAGGGGGAGGLSSGGAGPV